MITARTVTLALKKRKKVVKCIGKLWYFKLRFISKLFVLGAKSIQSEPDKVSDNEKQPKKDSSEMKEAVGAEDIFGDDLSIRYGNSICLKSS